MAYKDKFIIFKTGTIKWAIGTDDHREFELREIDLTHKEHKAEIYNISGAQVLKHIEGRVRPYLYAKVQQFLISIA